MWDQSAALSLSKMEKLRADFVDLMSSTNACMPGHAHTLSGTLQSIGFQHRSIYRSVQNTLWFCLLHFGFLRWYCEHMHTHTHTTQAGFADVCPDLLPTQAILMPVCWLWVFHTLLWNERRRRSCLPVAETPDSSHGFKVHPASECLPSAQSHICPFTYG